MWMLGEQLRILYELFIVVNCEQDVVVTLYLCNSGDKKTSIKIDPVVPSRHGGYKMRASLFYQYSSSCQSFFYQLL